MPIKVSRVSTNVSVSPFTSARPAQHPMSEFKSIIERSLSRTLFISFDRSLSLTHSLLPSLSLSLSLSRAHALFLSPFLSLSFSLSLFLSPSLSLSFFLSISLAIHKDLALSLSLVIDKHLSLARARARAGDPRDWHGRDPPWLPLRADQRRRKPLQPLFLLLSASPLPFLPRSLSLSLSRNSQTSLSFTHTLSHSLARSLSGEGDLHGLNLPP